MKTLKRNQRWLILLGLIFALTIEILDFVTGPHILFSTFHLLVVLFFVWYVDRLSGIICALILAFFSVLTDSWTGHIYYQNFATFIWAVIMRSTLFIIVALILSRLKDEMQLQKLQNDKLLHAYEEVQKLSKIKSDFTAMVSHELRTPLVAIRESLRLVYDGSTGPLNHEQKDFLERCQRNVERLARLIDNVLDYFKLETGKRELTIGIHNLNDLIKEVTILFTPVFQKKGISLKTSLDSKIPKVSFDYDAMSQVMNNLLNNALKFTEAGFVLIYSRIKEDQFIEIEIKDTGRGIANEDLPRLFLPFEQIPDKDGRLEGGSGLGLVISKQIIEMHRGKIEAKSELRKGTSIYITLPTK